MTRLPDLIQAETLIAAAYSLDPTQEGLTVQTATALAPIDGQKGGSADA